MSLRRRRLARAVVGTIVVLDLLVLLAFSFHTTTRTSTSTAGHVLAQPQPSTVVPGPETPPDIPASETPVGASDLARQTQQVADARTQPTAKLRPSTSTQPPPSTGPDDPQADVTLAPCPVDLPEPASSGGLQSLISLAPAFGPFKDEAFGLGPVYQPILTILGPLLAQYPKHQDELQPAVDAFLAVSTKVVDSGWAILGPLYSPYRAEFLAAEQKLSEALAPITRGIASSSIAGCLRSVQGILLNDTQKS